MRCRMTTESKNARSWEQLLSEELLVRFCAPTLAGIKAASLFTCRYEEKQEMIREIKELNRLLTDKGICVIPLRFEKGRCLVYMFRPAELKRCLSCSESREILREMGYGEGSIGTDITALARRIKGAEEFPHEIGLFLDYPAEDVKGFICHKGQRCKTVGTWKVYGDEEAARKTFQRYQKCTEIYCREAAKGVSIRTLAVAGAAG